MRNHRGRHADGGRVLSPLHLVLVAAVVVIAAVVALIQLAPPGSRSVADPGREPSSGPTAEPEESVPPSSDPPSPSPSAESPTSDARSPSTVSRTPSPPRPAAVFTAQFATLSEWEGGYAASVTVRNIGPGAGSWTVELRLPVNTRVTKASSVDGGKFSWRQTGRTVRFTGELPPGGTSIFGYEASRPTGETSEIVSCTINGARC